MPADQDEEKYRCGNCEFTAPRERFAEARDILQRMAIGDAFTDAECPQCGALAHPVKKKSKILQWLRDGIQNTDFRELDSVDDLITGVGRVMDKQCTGEIVGDILFRADDGKFYEGSLEFHIFEAESWKVEEALADLGGTVVEQTGACILPPDRVHTAEDCTMHDHELPELPKLYDVILVRKLDRVVTARSGNDLPLSGGDGELNARRRKSSVQMTWDAAEYSVFIVAAGAFAEGSTVPDAFISYL